MPNFKIIKDLRIGMMGFTCILMALSIIACSDKEPEKKPNPPTPPTPPVERISYPQIASTALPPKDAQGNILPDFSHIGYKGSDQPIPTVPVAETLDAPAGGADATKIIQDAIDRVSAKTANVNGFRGAILLKKGKYNISGTIKISKSGIVLRGEGSTAGGTVLVASGKGQRTLIQIWGSGSPSPSSTTTMNIKDDYVPVGQFWVRVKDASSFKVGDNVIVYRPGTDLWISDIKMDKITPLAPPGETVQWTGKAYNLKCERKVTYIFGDTIHFDNPIMMAMETKYGGGAVFKYTYGGRISECGVENMAIESEYASEEDEDHGWTAIEIKAAENCWVNNIVAKYFGYSAVTLQGGAKYVTVSNSKCLEAKSIITGSRRYSFNNNGGELSLFIDCATTQGRHDCVTGGKNVGPNAFVRVSATSTKSDMGPHQRWNVGTLYDCVSSDTQIYIQDRGNWGTGHGWAGVTNVLWNCTGSSVCVQSPWVSGKNYSIGTKGTKYAGRLSGRPDGVWIQPNATVSPMSLYDAQLKLRRETGRIYN